MKSRFLKLYDLFMEQIQNANDDKNFEFENVSLAIVPGSFKPPHKGHWEMIMNYVNHNDINKVIVLISNISSEAISSRSLSLSNLKDFGKIKEDFEKIYNESENKTALKDIKKIFDDLSEKSENISFNDLKNGLTSILTMNSSIEDQAFSKLLDKIQKYIDRLNKTLFGSIRKTANDTEITPKMSKEIFEIFANAYNVQNKVDIRISESASPVTATYKLVNDSCKNCKIFLGVSKKGGDDARWNNLKESEENPTNELISLPVDVETMISATELRNKINDLQKSWFPDKLTDEDFEKIKEILSK